jgi:SAM-dependent methyltransferase
VDAARADPRLSFDNAVEAYHEIRPRYPAAMFDDLFRILPPRPLMLEVGPGTGQATGDLLDRGAKVHAIEIGPRVAAAQRNACPSKELTITVADFERAPIVEHRVDAVFSASAYHWISPRAQVDRPAVILQPGGIIAIATLTQVDSPDDHGFFAAAQPIYDRYGEAHTGPPAPRRSDVDPPMRAALRNDPRFANVEVRRYDWNQTYRASQYRTLMISYSVMQMMDPAARQGLLDDMEQFIEHEFGGQVTRPLVLTLTSATLATSARS